MRIWYSRTNLKGAQQWHNEIGKALKRCDWFLVVLSPGSVRSMWVKRELVYVLQNVRYEDRIIPVLCKPCDPARLSWVLSSFQQVDFTGKVSVGCQALLKIWGLDF